MEVASTAGRRVHNDSRWTKKRSSPEEIGGRRRRLNYQRAAQVRRPDERKKRTSCQSFFNGVRVERTATLSPSFNHVSHSFAVTFLHSQRLRTAGRKERLSRPPSE